MPIEEMFNRIKRNVAGGSNTVCTPQRAMAVAIDTQVLSKLNDYDEISREGEGGLRNFAFNKFAFKPPFAKSNMDADVVALDLKRIVGAGEASWFSPNAANSSAPYADNIACRLVQPHIRKLETAWLSRLFGPSLAFKKIGSPTWYCALGDVCGVLIKAWPLKSSGAVYSPITTDDSAAINAVCTDTDLFEAMPLNPVSPMHRACLQEINEVGYMTGTLVRLRASGDYGHLPIAALPGDMARGLLNTQLRLGFGTLGPSYLQKLVHYLDGVMQGTSLFDLLCTLAVSIEGESLTRDVMLMCLNARSITFEDDEEIAELIELEYVLDCFDAGERTTLAKEIKDAKDKKSQRIAYDKSVCEYKVHHS